MLATFVVSGVAFASWASRIPTIRAQLDLKAGDAAFFLAGKPSAFSRRLTFWKRSAASLTARSCSG